MPTPPFDKNAKMIEYQTAIEQELFSLKGYAQSCQNPYFVCAIHILENQIETACSSDTWSEAQLYVDKMNILLSDPTFFPQPIEATISGSLATIKRNLVYFFFLKYQGIKQQAVSSDNKTALNLFKTRLDESKKDVARYQAINELVLALEQLNASVHDNRITTICYALKQEMTQAITASTRGLQIIESTSSHTRIEELFQNAQHAFEQEPTRWERIKQLFLEFFINLRLKLKLIDTPTAQAEMTAPKPTGKEILNNQIVQEKLTFFKSLPHEPSFSFADEPIELTIPNR